MATHLLHVNSSIHRLSGILAQHAAACQVCHCDSVTQLDVAHVLSDKPTGGLL